LRRREAVWNRSGAGVKPRACDPSPNCFSWIGFRKIFKTLDLLRSRRFRSAQNIETKEFIGKIFKDQELAWVGPISSFFGTARKILNRCGLLVRACRECLQNIVKEELTRKILKIKSFHHKGHEGSRRKSRVVRVVDPLVRVFAVHVRTILLCASGGQGQGCSSHGNEFFRDEFRFGNRRVASCSSVMQRLSLSAASYPPLQLRKDGAPTLWWHPLLQNLGHSAQKPENQELSPQRARRFTKEIAGCSYGGSSLSDFLRCMCAPPYCVLPVGRVKVVLHMGMNFFGTRSDFGIAGSRRALK